MLHKGKIQKLTEFEIKITFKSEYSQKVPDFPVGLKVSALRFFSVFLIKLLSFIAAII